VKRILTHIVNANQNYIQGQKVGGAILNIEEDLFKDREYTLDAKELLQGEHDKNYQRIYDAFDYLQGKFITYEDSEIRFRVPFVTAVYAKKRNGTIRFRMSELIYKAFADYTKGFRKYELQISLSLTSVYSIRLYELISGQQYPLTYTITGLKEMFQVQDKYKNVNDFIRFVIEPAKKELDEKSPYSFEYSINKKSRAFHSITFHPVHQPKYRDEDLETKDLQKKTALSWILDRNTKDYLTNGFSFTTAEIKQNIALFDEANKTFDLIAFMSKVKPKANRANNPKGYLINAIKLELKAKK
jgi:plasmid replication initiation protein